MSVPLDNVRLARAALAKARRHLRAAWILNLCLMPDQAYAHTVLAIEECAVFQLRRQVADREAEFDQHEASRLGVEYIDERILTRHPEKQGAFSRGVTAVAAVSALIGLLVLASTAQREGKKPGPVGAALVGLLLIAAGASVFVPDVESWEARKQAAFYSGPRKPGDPVLPPPSRNDFRKLFAPARNWINATSKNARRWSPTSLQE